MVPGVRACARVPRMACTKSRLYPSERLETAREAVRGSSSVGGRVFTHTIPFGCIVMYHPIHEKAGLEMAWKAVRSSYP